MLALPSTISIVLIYPRPHYVLPLVVMALIIMMYVLRCLSVRLHRLSIVAGIICTIVAYTWATTTTPQALPSWKIDAAVISKLRDTVGDRPVTILEMEGGYSLYLARGSEWVLADEKAMPFSAYMENEHSVWPNGTKRGVDIVVASPRLIKHPAYSEDADWATFTNRPGSFGFVRLAGGTPSRDIYIREEIRSDRCSESCN